MTRNSKVVLGVAAGVAALAVAGMYAKKKGYLNNINTDGLKNSLGGLKDTALKAFGGSKGSELSHSNTGSSMNLSSESTGSVTNGASKRKGNTSSLASGTNDINPATA